VIREAMLQVCLISGYPEEHIVCAVNPGRGQMRKINCWTEAYEPPKKPGFLWCLPMPWSFSFQRALGEVVGCHPAGQQRNRTCVPEPCPTDQQQIEHLDLLPRWRRV